MEKLNTQDGQLFIKNLASFVRTHERALANAIRRRYPSSKSVDSSLPIQKSTGYASSTSSTTTTSTLVAALSLGMVSYQHVRPAKLTLTPHHLFYLLSRFEEFPVPVGPLNVRLENINAEASSAYVSFLKKPQRHRGDRDSIHSVSSVRSVFSGMSSIWSSIGLGSKDSGSKSGKTKLAIENDLKYLYSAFTKIPNLRLAPDHNARLIRGYEEFPLDTAVPLYSFKNLSALEIIDIDFRSFFGWDRLAEQLRSLTLRRANIDDPADLLSGVVFDDMEGRRRRSTKSQQASPVLGSTSGQIPTPMQHGNTTPPRIPAAERRLRSKSSPQRLMNMAAGDSSEDNKGTDVQSGYTSPSRPATSRVGSGSGSGSRHTRDSSGKIKRSGSGSSESSLPSSLNRNGSESNILAANGLPASKWRFLRHLSLTDNSLTHINAISLAPVADVLQSLDLSHNLFTDVPECLSSLVSLRSLNLSQCMINSLHSLSRSPLPAITALNLRGNRLRSIVGVERLLSLERLDLRDNNLSDPAEIARLTCLPCLREIWVSGNPFCRAYPYYRITIFNLFRSTPGFSEDIIIDSTGPTYGERKQVVDRVVETEPVPVVRKRNEEVDAIAAGRTAEQSGVHPLRSSEPQPAQAGASTASLGDRYAVESAQRRKVLRRRVVALSLEETPAEHCPRANVEEDEATEHITIGSIASPFSVSGQARDDVEVAQLPVTPTIQPPRLATCPLGSSQTDLVSLETSSLSLDTTSEAYRQRLQTLKQELGTNWLTVLGDGGWDDKGAEITPRGTGIATTGPIRPVDVARTNGQMITTGGDRMLG